MQRLRFQICFHKSFLVSKKKRVFKDIMIMMMDVLMYSKKISTNQGHSLRISSGDITAASGACHLFILDKVHISYSTCAHILSHTQAPHTESQHLDQII